MNYSLELIIDLPLCTIEEKIILNYYLFWCNCNCLCALCSCSYMHDACGGVFECCSSSRSHICFLSCCAFFYICFGRCFPFWLFLWMNNYLVSKLIMSAQTLFYLILINKQNPHPHEVCKMKNNSYLYIPFLIILYFVEILSNYYSRV